MGYNSIITRWGAEAALSNPRTLGLSIMIIIINRIRSATEPFDLLRIIPKVMLASLKTTWKASSFASRKDRVRILARGAFKVASQHRRSCVKRMAYGWRTPIAYHVRRTCIRLLEKQECAVKNGLLTKELCKIREMHIARILLTATFDRVTVQHISTFAARMGLYQLEEGKPVFKHPLEPQEVISLMENRVPAVCISYKHTRRSMEGLPKDVARVHSAVAHTASQLSQERLLFWCDIIGKTPRGVSWAQRGIDPYLCMPTLRIISAKLKEQIDDSFWMTIERIAGVYRGGTLWYDEDEARLEFGSSDSGYTLAVPILSFPFEMAKLAVAKLICSPMLYYRRARYEEDKLEVMKYAFSAFSEHWDLFDLQKNAEGLFKLGSDGDMQKAFQAISTERVATKDISSRCYARRSQREIIIRDGQRWRGVEESFPASQLLEPQLRELLNIKLREDLFWTRRVGPPVDNITDVLCTPMANLMWCSAVRLRVVGFQEHADRFTGRVVSFRIASEEEELSFTIEGNIRKKICFH